MPIGTILLATFVEFFYIWDHVHREPVRRTGGELVGSTILGRMTIVASTASRRGMLRLNMSTSNWKLVDGLTF